MVAFGDNDLLIIRTKNMHNICEHLLPGLCTPGWHRPLTHKVDIQGMTAH